MSEATGCRYIKIEFHSDEQERLYDEALTGNDNDVMLAMENAVNERLGIDPELHEPDRIWLWPIDNGDLL